MTFPINFAQKNGNHSNVSSIINFTGNAAIAAVGGLSLGAVSYLALKALGFSTLAVATAAFPVSIGVFAATSTLLGAGALCFAMVAGVVQALKHRY